MRSDAAGPAPSLSEGCAGKPIRTGTVIIGAGFSGLGMAIALQKEGRHDFVVLEKASGVGGTWFHNTYPGCACDVPSHLYSFSFDQNPGWSKLWSGQPEILEYLEGVAARHGLGPHLRLNTTVAGARWDDETHTWRVATASGQEYVARYLVSGVGALHVPSIPRLPGIEGFAGPAFHSAAWDHSVDLAGKRVAVVGTGASAVQLVPQIVDKVAELHLYQRTAPWVFPRTNVPIPAAVRSLFRRVPLAHRALRAQIYWTAELGAYAMNRRPALLNGLAFLGRRYIASQIKDPALREKVTPRYTPGCKRLLGSDTYYKALANPKTQVVVDGIDHVEGNTLVSRDGTRREADVVVYGTGFSVDGSYRAVGLFGAGGEDLHERWAANGIQGHLGVTVAGVPNAFILLGPNTGLGHNSIVFMIEAQIRYAVQAMRLAESRGATSLAAKPAAQARFNDEVQRKLATAVWSVGGCKSWYVDEHGRNWTLWPGFTWEYWLRTRKVDAAEFDFATVPARGAARPQPANA
ncbi:MAG: flavin-containing monooxygenase [Segniliparus sp.]|uniref:flavin-containing monooxygenase n=1 Tax=Segniliparus sp. TaxID=2804064 RepID=UPI003F2E18BF